MGSAHSLVEVNVSFKFEGNPSISKGDIERTRIGDGPTDRPTDRRTDRPTRQSESSIAPPTFCGGGITSDMSCINHHEESLLFQVWIEHLTLRFAVPDSQPQQTKQLYEKSKRCVYSL